MKISFMGLVAGVAVAFATHPAMASDAGIGTVTVCYYSTECAFANIPGIVHPPNEAQKLRDSGEHQGGRRIIRADSVPAVDAPAFQFTNTGSLPITGASFTIEANKAENIARDVFHIGTIKPGASFVIVPGASNDKKSHAAGAFFFFSAPGTPLDTSDSGPDDNDIRFEFRGKVGTQTVSSGFIKPGKSLSPSVDGSVASLNFLGGPGNADGPCNDCYAAKTVATIVPIQTK